MIFVEGLRLYTPLKVPDFAPWPNILLGYLLLAIGLRKLVVDTGSHFPFPALWFLVAMAALAGILLATTRKDRLR